MLVPIRRWRAAGVGVIVVLASHSAASLSAGVVAPPEFNPPPAAETSSALPQQVVRDIEITLPLPSDSSMAEPFWFPGADGGEGTSISSVPVRSPVDDLHATAPFPGTQQHPLIPLPGAAWTGMAGLLGLGAVKLLRNFRKLLA